MPTAAMIFNGIHFYPPVADAAFKWAAQPGGNVLAVFVKCKNEIEEGYGFPSDMDAAENRTTGKDADADDNAIIASYIRLLEHQAIDEKITCRAQVLEDPSIQAFQMALQGCAVIFIEERKESDDRVPAGIDVKKLLREIIIPVETVQ